MDLANPVLKGVAFQAESSASADGLGWRPGELCWEELRKSLWPKLSDGGKRLFKLCP